jgi:hypothetical protein
VSGTQELERDAERLVRLAATDGCPVDVGMVGQLTQLIREAYALGQEELRDLAESELRELANMQGAPDPDEVESVQNFLRKLHFYGVPESVEEEFLPLRPRRQSGHPGGQHCGQPQQPGLSRRGRGCDRLLRQEVRDGCGRVGI